MKIEAWALSDSARLAALYNAQMAEVPYEHPVAPEDFAAAVARPLAGLSEQLLLVAVEAGRPSGYIHVGKVSGDDGSDEKGVIRSLAFPRDRRAVGQALLDRAHEHLHGLQMSACQAYPADHGYPCSLFEGLRSPWEHLYALLGQNGYRPDRITLPDVGDSYRTLIMFRPDVDIPEPVLPERGLEVQISDEPFFPKQPSYGDRPKLVVRVFRGGERIGGIETRPYYVPEWGPVPQDTSDTVGFGVSEEERGRGLGRYIIERSLFEWQQLGYRHAILGVASDNYPALMLYASMGYRTVYSVCRMTKAMG